MDTIRLVNSTSHELMSDVIFTPYSPGYLEYNPLNKNIYVTHSDASISVINESSNQVEDIIQLGGKPTEMIFNPSNNNLYASIGNSDYMYEINGTTNQIEDTIYLGLGIKHLLFNPINNYLYVSNGNNMSVFNSSGDLIQELSNEGYIKDLAYNPVDKNIYVSLHYLGDPHSQDRIMVLDGTRHSKLYDIPAGALSEEIVFNPNNDFMYITKPWEQAIYILNTTSVL
jgi:YVTN family beta-propeller protein